jgi:hypothetical protein
LGATHRGDAAGPDVSLPARGERREADLGDLVIALLFGSLAGVRDRLAKAGFERAAALVADLVEAAEDFPSSGRSPRRSASDG